MTATMERPTMAPPTRSLEQQMAALAKGNYHRTYRAELKRDLKAGRASAFDVLWGGVDERLATMKATDLLLAIPKLGRVKVNRILTVERISPSKTLGGLSDRQRRALILALARYHGGRVPSRGCFGVR
jgi:hypothetical protein